MEGNVPAEMVAPSDQQPPRATLSVATPRPWRWEFNEKGKRFQLVGGGHWIVMDFVRYGMMGAAPRFRADDGLLYRADEFAVAVPGREHHKHWYQGIDHPDAALIAAGDRPAATDRERRLEALLVEALPFVVEAKKHVWTIEGVTKALRLIDAIREEVGG